MRHFLAAITLALISASCTLDGAAAPRMTFVEYQGQRFDLAKAYDDFDDYKNDPENLTPEQARRAESLMVAAKFGPRFKDRREFSAALVALEFPGYGLFYANQLGAQIDTRLELAYVEVPARNLSRYIALERQADGSLLVVDDFVADAVPEIVRVQRGADGALLYRQHDGKLVVPVRRTQGH